MDIIDQIARAKQEIKSWPAWMRDAARETSATLGARSMNTASIALADLPPLEAPQIKNLRAELLQREIDDLRAANAEMRTALRIVLDELTPGHRPYSTDSYLPEHLVSVVRRALATGGRP